MTPRAGRSRSHREGTTGSCGPLRACARTCTGVKQARADRRGRRRCLGTKGAGCPGLRGPAEPPGPASPPRPRDPEGRPLGETPNTGLDIHLLPLRPKPGASCTDGTTWQISKALKTKKETNMCISCVSPHIVSSQQGKPRAE